MFGYRVYSAVVAIALGIALLPVALAKIASMEPGYSGGPAGVGQNCTLCHLFGEGTGRVQLLGVPQRYRPGVVYDLTVRVSDSEQMGAGFEISAEGAIGHIGDFLLRDAVNTRYADTQTTDYVTHTRNAFEDSVANWAVNGNAYEFILAWQAPLVDSGPVTFFTAGQAVNNNARATGDHYYADHVTVGFAQPGDGDADGDGDVDLEDLAVLQRCFNGSNLAAGAGCEYVDFENNGTVSLNDVAAWVGVRSGPAVGFALADAVRGGLLYDRWWTVNGAVPPVGNHPLYPSGGPRTGSATFRCSECHGWDYKGRDGVYGSGNHFTGIRGVFGTTLNPRQMFDLLKADPLTVPNGHNMDAFGMSDRDLWDVVKFTTSGVIDTNAYIAPSGAFIGDQGMGGYLYSTLCESCHFYDGKFLNFGTTQSPVYIGTVANSNPWQFLHRVRLGYPGSSMPSTDLLGWSEQDAADIGAYSATLPQQ